LACTAAILIVIEYTREIIWSPLFPDEVISLDVLAKCNELAYVDVLRDIVDRCAGD